MVFLASASAATFFPPIPQLRCRSRPGSATSGAVTQKGEASHAHRGPRPHTASGARKQEDASRDVGAGRMMLRSGGLAPPSEKVPDPPAAAPAPGSAEDLRRISPWAPKCTTRRSRSSRQLWRRAAHERPRELGERHSEARAAPVPLISPALQQLRMNVPNLRAKSKKRENMVVATATTKAFREAMRTLLALDGKDFEIEDMLGGAATLLQEHRRGKCIPKKAVAQAAALLGGKAARLDPQAVQDVQDRWLQALEEAPMKLKLERSLTRGSLVLESLDELPLKRSVRRGSCVSEALEEESKKKSSPTRGSFVLEALEEAPLSKLRSLVSQKRSLPRGSLTLEALDEEPMSKTKSLPMGKTKSKTLTRGSLTLEALDRVATSKTNSLARSSFALGGLDELALKQERSQTRGSLTSEALGELPTKRSATRSSFRSVLSERSFSRKTLLPQVDPMLMEEFQQQRQKRLQHEQLLSEDLLLSPNAHPSSPSNFKRGITAGSVRLEKDDEDLSESAFEQRLQTVFRRLQDDGEIRIENLMIALELAGFARPEKKRVDAVLSEITSYQTLDLGEFVKFANSYEASCEQAALKVFEKYDLDGSGSIDAEELRLLFEDLGIAVMDQVCQEIVAEVDVLHTGSLDPNQFRKVLDLVKTREGFTKRELEKFKRVFYKFDVDGNGTVDAMEMTLALSWLGYTMPDEVVVDIVSEVNVGGVKEGLQLHEFMVCMRKIRQAEVSCVKSLLSQVKESHIGTIAMSNPLEKMLKALGYAPDKRAIMDAAEDIGLIKVDRTIFQRNESKGRESISRDGRESISGHKASIVGMNRSSISVQQPIRSIASRCSLTPDLRAIHRMSSFGGPHALQPSGFGVSELFRFVEVYRSREGFDRSQAFEIEQAFVRYDQKGGAGEITIYEAAKVLRWFGYVLPWEEFHLLAKQVDIDRNGLLDFVETRKLMRKFRERDLKIFREAFVRHDVKRRGRLTDEQMWRALRSLGLQETSPAQVQRHIMIVKSGGDVRDAESSSSSSSSDTEKHSSLAASDGSGFPTFKKTELSDIASRRGTEDDLNVQSRSATEQDMVQDTDEKPARLRNASVVFACVPDEGESDSSSESEEAGGEEESEASSAASFGEDSDGAVDAAADEAPGTADADEASHADSESSQDSMEDYNNVDSDDEYKINDVTCRRMSSSQLQRATESRRGSTLSRRSSEVPATSSRRNSEVAASVKSSSSKSENRKSWDESEAQPPEMEDSELGTRSSAFTSSAKPSAGVMTPFGAYGLLEDDESSEEEDNETSDIGVFFEIATRLSNKARNVFRLNAGFTDEQVEKLRIVFKQFDTDNSGDISHTELRVMLENLFPEISNTARQRPFLISVMKETDFNADGHLDFSDFLRLMRQFQDAREREGIKKEAQAIQDTQFSQLEVEEFREVFLQHCSHTEVNDVFSETRAELAFIQLMDMLKHIINLTIKPHTCPLEILFASVTKSDPEGEIPLTEITCDFPEFLNLMRKLLDSNTADILGQSARIVENDLKARLMTPMNKQLSMPANARKGSIRYVEKFET